MFQKKPSQELHLKNNLDKASNEIAKERYISRRKTTNYWWIKITIII